MKNLNYIIIHKITINKKYHLTNIKTYQQKIHLNIGDFTYLFLIIKIHFFRNLLLLIIHSIFSKMI